MNSLLRHLSLYLHLAGRSNYSVRLVGTSPNSLIDLRLLHILSGNDRACTPYTSTDKLLNPSSSICLILYPRSCHLLPLHNPEYHLYSVLESCTFRRSCSSQSPPPCNRSIARICGCTHRRGQAHCSGIRSNFKKNKVCLFWGRRRCSSRVDVPDSSANWLSPGAKSLQASSGAYLFGDPCSWAALVQPPP